MDEFESIPYETVLISTERPPERAFEYMRDLDSQLA
jgi:hypothetical protein